MVHSKNVEMHVQTQGRDMSGKQNLESLDSGIPERETAWTQILPLSLGTCKLQMEIGVQSELNDLIHTGQAAETLGQSKYSVNV